VKDGYLQRIVAMIERIKAHPKENVAIYRATSYCNNRYWEKQRALNDTLASLSGLQLLVKFKGGFENSFRFYLNCRFMSGYP